jgi:copper chaperone CopZ
MTCASCANAVRESVEHIPGVSEVAVDLIGKSATAVIARKDLAEVMKQNIEDVGYDAEVVSLESIRPISDKSGSGIEPSLWTADFDIQGMTCASCESSVRTAVEKLPFVQSVDVVSPLFLR